MEQIIRTIISAAGAFSATNLDDIFVLMLFFSHTNQSFTNGHVIIGQYLGIGVLVLISAIGSLGALVIPQQYVDLLGLIPIYIGLKQWFVHEKDDEDERKEISSDGRGNSLGYRSGIIKVAVITIANGGDNIGIYIPFFANQGAGQMMVTILVFMVLTGVWCVGGMNLAKHPKVAVVIEARGQQIVPIVFILLGFYILSGV